MSTPHLIVPPVRPEYEVTPAAHASIGHDAPLPISKRLADHAWLRKSLIAIVLIALWEIAARAVDNDLLLPTFSATSVAFAQGIASG